MKKFLCVLLSAVALWVLIFSGRAIYYEASSSKKYKCIDEYTTISQLLDNKFEVVAHNFILNDQLSNTPLSDEENEIIRNAVKDAPITALTKSEAEAVISAESSENVIIGFDREPMYKRVTMPEPTFYSASLFKIDGKYYIDVKFRCEKWKKQRSCVYAVNEDYDISAIDTYRSEENGFKFYTDFTKLNSKMNLGVVAVSTSIIVAIYLFFALIAVGLYSIVKKKQNQGQEQEQEQEQDFDQTDC